MGPHVGQSICDVGTHHDNSSEFAPQELEFVSQRFESSRDSCPDFSSECSVSC